MLMALEMEWSPKKAKETNKMLVIFMRGLVKVVSYWHCQDSGIIELGM